MQTGVFTFTLHTGGGVNGFILTYNLQACTILLICHRIALPTRGGLLAQMKRLFKVYNLKFRKIKITKGHHVFWILKQTKLTYDKLLICFEVQESGHTFSPA